MVTLYKERGQVDLILTDPPYNTGQTFRYNDKWDEDPNDPDLGQVVKLEDGSRHTKWMKAMLPRLHMMHAMLKPSGVIAICIDDNDRSRQLKPERLRPEEAPELVERYNRHLGIYLPQHADLSTSTISSWFVMELTVQAERKTRQRDA